MSCGGTLVGPAARSAVFPCAAFNSLSLPTPPEIGVHDGGQLRHAKPQGADLGGAVQADGQTSEGEPEQPKNIRLDRGEGVGAVGLGAPSPLPPQLTTPLPSFLQANLSEQQVSSNTFIRALMTSVCHSAIVCE